MATYILSKSSTSLSDMVEWAILKNAHPTFIENAEIYYRLCMEVGVNPVIAYVQYAKETKYGKFGGVVKESYHNPCGLKNPTNGGCKDPGAYAIFKDWEEGIQAHIDHLALYAKAKGYPKVNSPDPKHYKSLYGYCETVEDLEGTWALSKGYANDLLKFKNEVEYSNTFRVNINK